MKFLSDRGMFIDRMRFQHLMFINKKNLERQRLIYKNSFGIRRLDCWEGFYNLPKKIDFQKFNRSIEKIKEESFASFAPDLYQNELIDFYCHNRGPRHYRKFCTAPWHQLNLLPNGDIYTCPDYILGNIKEESLENIWNGPRAKKLRRYVSHNLFPACRGCFFHYTDRAQ